MSAVKPPVRLFIGSSVEGQDIAVNLQVLLETREICEVDLWEHVFEPSSFALPSLLKAAGAVDFAVLIATPDDTTFSRGTSQDSIRDNIILEFGLFAGTLGLDRTYLLSTGKDLRLPSDVLGLTRLQYVERSDKQIRPALNSAVLSIQRQINKLGPREPGAADRRPTGSTLAEDADHNRTKNGGPEPSVGPPREPRWSSGIRDDAAALNDELKLLITNAQASGWKTKATQTTFRVKSPKGRSFVLSHTTPADTRVRLRDFARELQSAGLRLNNVLLRAPDQSPF